MQFGLFHILSLTNHHFPELQPHKNSPWSWKVQMPVAKVTLSSRKTSGNNWASNMIVYESSYFHLIWSLLSASKLPLGLSYFVMFSAHPVITSPLNFQGKGQSPHDSMEKYHHLFPRRACAMGYIGMATFGKCHLPHQRKERFSYSFYKNK